MKLLLAKPTIGVAAGRDSAYKKTAACFRPLKGFRFLIAVVTTAFEYCSCYQISIFSTLPTYPWSKKGTGCSLIWRRHLCQSSPRPTQNKEPAGFTSFCHSAKTTAVTPRRVATSTVSSKMHLRRRGKPSRITSLGGCDTGRRSTTPLNPTCGCTNFAFKNHLPSMLHACPSTCMWRTFGYCLGLLNVNSIPSRNPPSPYILIYQDDKLIKASAVFQLWTKRLRVF